MPPVQVHATLRDPEVVVGCALGVDITLTSTSPRALVEVQSPEADSPFEFSLRSPEHGEFVVGKRLFEQARDLHGGPPFDPPRRALRPGDSAEYVEDVARWYVAVPPAGDYTLEVRWLAPDGSQVAAPPLHLTIAELRPHAAATAVDGSGQYLTTVFARGDDQATLFHRDAEPGRPDLGHATAWTRTGRPIGGLALAHDVDDVLRWRWAAWLVNGAFAAAIVWGTEVVKTVDPGPHGLDDATLLPGGWQLADGAALFVLLGTRGGRAVVDLVHLPPGGPPRHDVRDLDAPLPALATAGLWGRALGVVELVRADATGAAVTIGTQHIELAAAGVEPVQDLFVATGRPRALATAPLLTDDAIVDALVGDGTLHYHRAPLLGGAPTVGVLQPPARGVVTCSIAQVPHPDRPILAGNADGLWVSRRGTSWTLLTEREALHPRLIHMTPPDGLAEGRLMAAWFDPKAGLQVRELSDEDT
jgi:hypothetical protein